MRGAMELALRSARCDPSSIDYVNAHATGTTVGDIAESQATHALFGDRVPVSSLKGNLGHTLGACGALEVAFSISMLRDGWIAPTRNLEVVDEQCAPLDYVMGEARSAKLSAGHLQQVRLRRHQHQSRGFGPLRSRARRC